jgi:hypothetical protein
LVIQPALAADSRNVVRAKAARPSGAGSAIGETALAVGSLVVMRSSLTLTSSLLVKALHSRQAEPCGDYRAAI